MAESFEEISGGFLDYLTPIAKDNMARSVAVRAINARYLALFAPNQANRAHHVLGHLF
jgi:hypothetical protein